MDAWDKSIAFLYKLRHIVSETVSIKFPSWRKYKSMILNIYECNYHVWNVFKSFTKIWQFYVLIGKVHSLNYCMNDNANVYKFFWTFGIVRDISRSLKWENILLMLKKSITILYSNSIYLKRNSSNYNLWKYFIIFFLTQ